MSDPFSLLGLARRPLLSEAEIGTAYRRLAGSLHPDQPEGDAAAFRALGEAAAILRDPARRLRELTDGDTAKGLPAQAADLFQKIAAILQQCDQLTAQYASASNALSKALLVAPLKTFSVDLKATLDLLQTWRASLDRELQELDQLWPEYHSESLALLADSFAYAGRWEMQLRERELALAGILS